jgi:hypothetical protein
MDKLMCVGIGFVAGIIYATSKTDVDPNQVFSKIPEDVSSVSNKAVQKVKGTIDDFRDYQNQKQQ